MDNFNVLIEKIRDINVKVYFLAISMFFLPLNLNLNNIFLVLFFCIYIIEGQFQIKLSGILKNYKYILPLFFLFIVIVFGYFNSFYTHNAFKQIERSLPLLLIPIIFISHPKYFIEYKDKVFYGLVLGCIVAAIISWSGLIYDLLSKEEFHRIFTWEYSKRNLINMLDQHTPYLSMFVFTSIGFLVYKLEVIKQLRYRVLFYFVGFFLFLFLLHLLSRTSILFFVMSAIIYLLIKRNWRSLIIFSIIIISFFSTLLFNSEDKSNYFERLLIEQIGISEKGEIDPRFDRWQYSLEIFKKHPLIGAGTGDIDALRSIKYRENNDIVAFKEKYNAHNQFFETLSAQGIIGGIAYLFCFSYLIILAIKTKEYFYLFVLLGVFTCCLTESMFRRSWGIVFFSITASFLILSFLERNEKRRVFKQK